MKLTVLTVFTLFLTLSLSAQKSTGEYDSEKNPIGTHTMTDAKDGTEYTMVYTDEHILRKLTVVSGDSKIKHKLPKTIEKYKWSEIKPGLSITLKEPAEGWKTTFDGKREFKVHYAGHLAVDGKKFDSSFYRNQPLTGKYANLIKGFSLGMANMKPGDFAVLKISPELGYGDRDLGPIPPNSTLLFYIYMIEEPGAVY